MCCTEASWAVKEQDREIITEGENKADKPRKDKRGKVCVCALCACGSMDD